LSIIFQVHEYLLNAVNAFKSKLGFKEEEEIKCPAHKVEQNFDPAYMDTIPGLKTHVQFLKNVKLSQNVETLQDGFLTQFNQIETLDTEHCRLSELPKNMEMCKNLTTLKIAGCSISSLPLNITALSNQLTYLDISRTNMRSAMPEIISCLISLKTLMADYLFLTSLPLQIGNLKNLEHLSLKGNLLHGLPESFKELKSLTSLSMSGVPWMDVKPGFFVTADYFGEFMAHWNLTEDIMRRREVCFFLILNLVE
jgi:hypothetical protein